MIRKSLLIVTCITLVVLFSLNFWSHASDVKYEQGITVVKAKERERLPDSPKVAKVLEDNNQRIEKDSRIDPLISSIVAEFDDAAFVKSAGHIPGFVDPRERERALAQSIPTAQSAEMERKLKSMLLEIPYLDRKLVDRGTTCGDGICRVVGGFDETSPQTNIAVAVEKLGEISPEMMKRAGVYSKLDSTFMSSRTKARSFFRLTFSTPK